MLYKNAPRKDLITVFAVRFMLDILAYVHLLIKGKFGNAKAVVDAHKDFLSMRPHFKHERQENVRKTVVRNIPTKFKGSILWNFYARGKKTYSSL